MLYPVNNNIKNEAALTVLSLNRKLKVLYYKSVWSLQAVVCRLKVGLSWLSDGSAIDLRPGMLATVTRRSQ